MFSVINYKKNLPESSLAFLLAVTRIRNMIQVEVYNTRRKMEVEKKTRGWEARSRVIEI